MSLSNIQSSIQRMRDKIEDVKDVQLKTAMKYQYILGASKEEVAGNNYPKGSDVKKTQLTFEDSAYDSLFLK